MIRRPPNPPPFPYTPLSRSAAKSPGPSPGRRKVPPRLESGPDRRRWSPLAPLPALLRAGVHDWMRRRQGPDVLPVTLERRRLYILPTGAGEAFGMLLVLMLLAGLNYGNGLALFLTFSLTAFALVAMQQCHRNLLGIAVIAASAPPVFARTTGAVHLTLANPAHLERARLEAAVPEVAAVAADLPPHERQRLELPLPARTRGIVRIDRLRLATA